MAITALLAAAAEGHAVQQGGVVADSGGFADHDPRGVIDHDPDADARRRVDIDAEDARRLALKVKGKVPPPFLPQLVGEAMGDEGVEALEIKEWLDIAAAGRITIVDGGEVGAERPSELRAAGEHVLKHLPDEPGIDVGVIEALGKTMADGVLQPLVTHHRRKDEAAEGRLGADRLLRLAAHLGPDRIDMGYSALSCLSGRRCHDRSPTRIVFPPATLPTQP